MLDSIDISGRMISSNSPPYIVAELSANHQGDIGCALEMIDAAAECGVDAIKLQTYTADTITFNSERPEFQITQGPRKGMSLHQLYSKAMTPWEWHERLFERAKSHGLAAFSSPFDHSSIDFLEQLNCPAYKIASFEIVDIPLIKKAAATGKPIIISTGIANLLMVKEAIQACYDVGNKQVIILHCVSGYPTPVEESNLRTLPELEKESDCLIGLSDHTLSLETSIAAVALNACFIEKHFVLKRDSGAIDAAFSLEPHEFKQLVKSTKITWQALGKSSFELKASESYNARLQRSLYATEDIRKGEQFTIKNTRSVRPNNGLPPKHLPIILTATASRDIAKHTPLEWDMLILPGND